MEEAIKVENVEYTIDHKTLIDNITMHVKKGSFVGVIGPNGSGKSTLLKTIYRSYKVNKGCIYLNSRDIRLLSDKVIAREMAAVIQEHHTNFDLTVNEVMMSGQYAYYSFLSNNEKASQQRCDKALKIVEMEDFKYSSFQVLSGGEKQRVMIASAIARNPDVIVLDEPTNHLDINYQYMIMEILSKLNITIVMAIHDLNLALRYCNEVYVLNQGKIIASGNSKEVITPSMIKEIFKMEASIQKINQQEVICYHQPSR